MDSGQLLSNTNPKETIPNVELTLPVAEESPLDQETRELLSCPRQTQ